MTATLILDIVLMIAVAAAIVSALSWSILGGRARTDRLRRTHRSVARSASLRPVADGQR